MMVSGGAFESSPVTIIELSSTGPRESTAFYGAIDPGGRLLLDHQHRRALQGPHQADAGVAQHELFGFGHAFAA